MRWRKAHRNRRRVDARSCVRFVFPFHQLAKPAFYEISWQEWMDKIVPDVMRQNQIHRNDLFAQLMRRPEPLATYRNALIPRRHFDAMKHKAEAKRDWGRSVLEDLIPLQRMHEATVRHAAYYLNGASTLSELDRGQVERALRNINKMIDDAAFRGSRFVWVAPDPPQPTKEFIYGDNWAAYQRITKEV